MNVNLMVKTCIMLMAGLVFAQDHPYSRLDPSPDFTGTDLSQEIEFVYQRQDEILTDLLEVTPLPDGFIRWENGLLNIDGKVHPELIPLDYYLWDLTVNQYHESSEQIGNTKDQLLNFGFPLTELAKLTATKTDHSLRQQLTLHEEEISQRFPRLYDPTQTVSPEDMRVFLTTLFNEKREIKRAWATRCLGELSKVARNAIWTYIANYPKTYKRTYYNKVLPEQYVVSIYEQRIRRISGYDWSVNETASRDHLPKDVFEDTQGGLPSLITRASSGRPIWISSKDLQLVKDNEKLSIRLKNHPISDLMPEAHRNSLLRNFKAILQKKQQTESNSDLDCLSRSHFGLFNTTSHFEAAISKSMVIFMGTLENIETGLYYNREASMMTLRVNQWIRKPHSGGRDLYFIFHPKAKFNIGELSFCSENPNYVQNPIIGKRMLIMADIRPAGPNKSVLITRPIGIVAENNDGTIQWPKGIDYEATDFSHLIDLTSGLSKKWPAKLGAFWRI